jgi:hypothetical protein
MTVFIVTIGGFPNIYKKIEIRDEEFYGDDQLICDAMYVQKVVLVTTDELVSLGE